MHNSLNRRVNYHVFENKGNYPVIIINACDVRWVDGGVVEEPYYAIVGFIYQHGGIHSQVIV